MDINDRLYVEIHPFTGGQVPHPHPIDDAHFDPGYVYKVLGMYNPSETSECYMILSNTKRQIWFIPQRHLLAFALIDSDEFFLLREQAVRPKKASNGNGAPAANGRRLQLAGALPGQEQTETAGRVESNGYLPTDLSTVNGHDRD